MSCSEMNEWMVLALSGELSGKRMRRLKKHIHRCESCTEAWKELSVTWEAMRELPRDEPGPSVREDVLRHGTADAKRRSAAISAGRRPIHFRPVPRLVWAVSCSAAVIMLAVVLLRPVVVSRIGGVANGPSVYDWEDSFIQEADWIDQEIERVESGSLLPYYASGGLDVQESGSEWLSPMSGELERIRSTVQDLIKSIYGI